MSGVVGGAGSRSGVIGKTELEYEEGVFTGGIPNVSGPTCTNGYYRKIGALVFCGFKLNLATIVGNAGHGVGMSDLPFAALEDDVLGGSNNGFNYYIGNVWESTFIGDTTDNKSLYLAVHQGGTNGTIKEWGSDLLWNEMGTSGYLVCNITYLTAG